MKGRHSITINNILEVVTEEQILNYYLGITKLNGNMSSPLREDSKPSFAFKKYNDSIYYKDFALNISGNIYDLLMKYFNISYYELLEKMYLDLDKIRKSSNNDFVLTHNNKSKHKKNSLTLSNIKVIYREYKNYDIKYWEQYGISLEYLKLSNTYPISTIIIEKDDKILHIPADKYAYVFIEYKDNKQSIKIYQPFSKDYKWISKHDQSVWDLWSKLPDKGKYLIITSSRKDALCIWENTGIPAISLQAESYLPKKHVVQQLKDRFEYIFVLYDNDFTKINNPGEKAGNEIAKTFNLRKLTLPIELGEKDTSDLCKKYGRNKVKTTILKLIKNNLKTI